MHENDEDKQATEEIQWFHRLASLPRERLIEEATDVNRLAFYTFIDKQLPDDPGPSGLLAQEFADAVLHLRENERQWNRALGNAIIKADEVARAHGAQAAIGVLKEFARTCPWQYFRQVAKNQAANYLPGKP